MPSTKDLKTPLALYTCWLAVIAFMLLCKTGRAQGTQEVQFLPEVDAYLKLNPKIRVSFQAKDTREGGVQSGRDRP